MRIEPTELRLGNIIEYQKESVVVTAIFRNSLEMKRSTHICRDRPSETTPIPSTEEWLLKFGFTLAYSAIHENTFIYKKNDFTIEFFCGLIFVEGIQIDLKHVHQLQNLYFALTNKELTYES